MSAVSGVYTVIRPFKSNGKNFKRGEEWEPGGAKFDSKLIACGYVSFEPLRDDKSRAQRGRKGRPRNAAE